MVGAAGASAVTLDSFQAGDGIGHLHAGDEGGDALEVAVAAGGVLDMADDIALGLYIDLLRADKGAGLEGGAADIGLNNIRYQGYVKHRDLNYGAKLQPKKTIED